MKRIALAFLALFVVVLTIHLGLRSRSTPLKATGGTGTGMAQDATGQAILGKLGLTTPQGGSGTGALQDSTMQVLLTNISPVQTPAVPDAGTTDAATVVLTGDPADGGVSWQPSSSIAPAVNYTARLTALDSNDLHAWELTETNGTTYADTGSSAHPIALTISGCSAANFMMGQPGLLGPCPYNAAVSSCSVASVDISNATSSQPGGDLPTGTSPFTLEYWYRTAANSSVALPSGGWFTFTEIGGTNATAMWNVGPFNQSQWQTYINDNVSAPFSAPLTWSVRPNLEQWQYVASVYNGSTYAFYVDGIVVSTSGTGQVAPAWTTGGSSPRTLAVFGSSANGTNGANMLQGWISRVRLSNIARSASYIQGVYQKAMLY